MCSIFNNMVNSHIQINVNRIVLKVAVVIFVFMNQAHGNRNEAFYYHENTETDSENTPVILGSVKDYIQIDGGQDITINCDVKGNPTTSKAWYKVGNNVLLQFKYQIR